MIGLSLFGSASQNASSNWYISISTAILMVIFSEYIKDVPIPMPYYSMSKPRKFKFGKVYLFRLFPVLITIIVMWIICVILTVTDALPEGDLARADANLELIKNVDWFRVPYPCN